MLHTKDVKKKKTPTKPTDIARILFEFDCAHKWLRDQESKEESRKCKEKDEVNRR